MRKICWRNLDARPDFYVAPDMRSRLRYGSRMNRNASASIPKPQPAPLRWREAATGSECTLHQLSPYIGKLKSLIAGDLIAQFSKIGDLIVDPFCGAGTVPLEAVLRGRRAFGADVSAYARVLSSAKLRPPISMEKAVAKAVRLHEESTKLPDPDLRSVPPWVRRFFHQKTLREALKLAAVCRKPGNEFHFACLLGILHHQRPGFLSYPSSHLVPYLRTRKFPRERFPELYKYRPVLPRLLAKVRRSFRRSPANAQWSAAFCECAVENLEFPSHFDALITSPPYMNALDYQRDNRLRLWFIDPRLVDFSLDEPTRTREAFVSAIESVAKKAEFGLRKLGHCVFVVGEKSTRNFQAHPAQSVIDTMNQHAPSLNLQRVISDHIPDVRRTRRECRGVKREMILVFKRP